uniref:Uncharacterized protein n=1 Tax=Lotharella globosa TaxID=91324 RepID=A0A7S3YQV3_9EUKA|mmetsp:Transcript_22943/g.44688  ORF Transcript_22943/g.44688 Transcript_22943/m.44688 type:complete len:131 (+) Transcript_22943:213-605(+)
MYGKPKNAKLIPDKIYLSGWARWDETWPYVKGAIRGTGSTAKSIVIVSLPSTLHFQQKFKKDRAGYFTSSINNQHILKGFIYGSTSHPGPEDWELALSRLIRSDVKCQEATMLMFAIFSKCKTQLAFASS